MADAPTPCALTYVRGDDGDCPACARLKSTHSIDYLREAMAIAAGTSSMLTEKGHLLALAAEQAKSVRDLQTTMQIVASFLLMSKSDQLTVPPDVLKQVRDSRLQVFITRQNDGRIDVQKVDYSKPGPWHGRKGKVH